jgi:hypothetical protein
MRPRSVSGSCAASGGALHELYCELPRRQPGLRDHPRRGRPGAALGDAAAGRARPCGDGEPEAFNERLEVLPLCNERSASHFRPGIGWISKIASRSRMLPERPTCVGSIANTAIILPTSCVRWGWPCGSGSKSEREDWIQMMVAAGFGVCFLPEFSPSIPGLRTQPVTDPEVVPRCRWCRCLAGVSPRR